MLVGLCMYVCMYVCMYAHEYVRVSHPLVKTDCDAGWPVYVCIYAMYVCMYV
jgi:hypothetical protein